MNKNDFIILIDKPKDYTSRDVVNKLTKTFNTKKIGHTGTLDPLATGVLVCTVNKCNKLTEILTSSYKEYVVKFILGYETDTLDITGTTLYTSDLQVTNERIIEVINSFEKTYMQEVPKYSAVKVNGRKLYEYARNNEKVELPSKEVTIKKIKDIEINGNIISFTTLVSKGTYIRSLVRDIGKTLGTYATMSDLRRTKQGKYNIEDAYTLDQIESSEFKVIDLKEALSDIKKINTDEDLYKKVSNGVKLKLDLDDEYICFIYNDIIIALYKKCNNFYEMYVKF